MNALDELMLEVEKHAVLRAHAGLIASARAEVAHLRGDPSTLLGKTIKALSHYGMNMPNEKDIAIVAMWVSCRADGSLTSTMFREAEEPLTDELREKIAAVLRNLADIVEKENSHDRAKHVR